MSITSNYLNITGTSSFMTIIEEIPCSFWERYEDAPDLAAMIDALNTWAHPELLADIGVHNENDIKELAECIVNEGF